MFAVLDLPDFPLQAALRHEPDLWARPVALVDPALSTPRVCQFTDAARAAGVTTGLTPTQALARSRDLVIRHRSPAHERAATDALLHCAHSFSPHLEDTAPGLCTLDLRGLAELKNAPPETLARWAARLRASAAAVQLRVRLGLGPTPTLARHAARWGGEIRVVTEPETFIASLPIAALEPSSDVTNILQKWGIRTVAELLALGQDAVADRLGLEAFALFAAASARATRPLNLVRPLERFAEVFEFEDAIETLEPLLFLLRRFLDQLAPRLAAAGKVASELVLRLGLESGDALERRLRVPQPTREADVLFRMLHTHLEGVRSESAICSVALTAEPAEPQHKQFSLFETALRDPRQFQDTIARLTALLGADRVGTPVRENSHRPDAFKLIPPDFENAPPLAAAQSAAPRAVPAARRSNRGALRRESAVRASELPRGSRSPRG